VQCGVGQPLGGALELSHGNEVSISNSANVCVTKGDESLCPAGSEHELHIKTVWRVYIDYCAKIATTQTMLRQVTIQNDCV
jgi:hypothetical protein